MDNNLLKERIISFLAIDSPDLQEEIISLLQSDIIEFSDKFVYGFKGNILNWNYQSARKKILELRKNKKIFFKIEEIKNYIFILEEHSKRSLKSIVEDYILSWPELLRRSVEIKFFQAISEKIPCLSIDTFGIDPYNRTRTESLFRRMKQSFYFTPYEVVIQSSKICVLERGHLVNAFELSQTLR
jgi:hypothetical protein